MAERRIFVSYRRATDAVAALDLVADLSSRLGAERVFHDRSTDSLPPGIHWPAELLESIHRAESVLPVIGPGWREELRRRNQTDTGEWVSSTSSRDWVRKEIGLALGVAKRVIPVLVNGARLPQKHELPEDLHGLSDQQWQEMPAGDPERSTALEVLRKQVDLPRQPPALQGAWPWQRGERPTYAEEEGIYTPLGQPWSENSEKDTPHSYDYKFSILDPETRHRLRVLLLSAGEAGQLSAAFSLALLEQLGQPRKFAHSEKKKGMFLQASCLVTDGMESGNIERVLIAVRSNYQIHDPGSRRRVKGESCLHSTCLTSFNKHDREGHLSTAVLNSLTNPNPWAIFSRKLLFPDSLVDCRFLGIGYNFSNPEAEYLFIVWHVRSRHCPPSLLVPARQIVGKDSNNREVTCYDNPLWQSREEASHFDFKEALVDRLVMEQVVGVRFNDNRVGVDSPLVGFVPCAAFDLTHQNQRMPVRWFRDTVVLDLLRFYQQKVHRGQRTAPGANPQALLADLANYLRETIRETGLKLEVEAVNGAAERGEFGSALLLRLHDEDRRTVYPFMVVAASTTDEDLSSEVVERCRRQVNDGFAYLGARATNPEPQALFVLQGVRSEQRYRVQGALTLSSTALPIHVVKVALLPPKGEPGVKDVVHGIIPTRSQPGGPVDGLLVTRSFDDELPRLPGGKIEGAETPEQALVRELHEELDLLPGEIAGRFSTKLEGITVRAISPSTGLMTPYRFYPYVVRLTKAGRERVRTLVGQPQRRCRVAPVSLETFRTTGLGFDPIYAETCLATIPQELLAEAAVDLG